MAELQDLPAIKSYLSLANLTEDFCSACELVKDLPSGNGEGDWNNFEDLWQQVQSQNFVDVRNMIFEHASRELTISPLFEILFEFKEGAPPDTIAFASAGFGPEYESSIISMGVMRITTHFTAKEFLDICVVLDTDFLEHMEFGHHPLTPVFMDMLRTLHVKKVNVLEFLSTEETDTLLEICPLFRVIMHSLSASACQVFIEIVEVRSALVALKAPQGFHSQGDSMHIPPYPLDERYGLTYDYAQFLQCMQNAEAHIDQFQFAAGVDDGHSSFDILHRWIHDMEGRVTVAEFMAGREPAEGNPGAIIYNHLINACTPALDCNLFFANIVSNGDGEAFLENEWQNAWQNGLQQLPKNPGVISRLDAITLVDKLKKVDVADITRENMKCMHCWGQFDEVEEGVDNLPVQLPCDSRHMLGRDCLIGILVETGPLCPLCRVDIVALSARQSTG